MLMSAISVYIYCRADWILFFSVYRKVDPLKESEELFGDQRELLSVTLINPLDVIHRWLSKRHEKWCLHVVSNMPNRSSFLF